MKTTFSSVFWLGNLSLVRRSDFRSNRYLISNGHFALVSCRYLAARVRGKLPELLIDYHVLWNQLPCWKRWVLIWIKRLLWLKIVIVKVDFTTWPAADHQIFWIYAAISSLTIWLIWFQCQRVVVVVVVISLQNVRCLWLLRSLFCLLFTFTLFAHATLDTKHALLINL